MLLFFSWPSTPWGSIEFIGREEAQGEIIYDFQWMSQLWFNLFKLFETFLVIYWIANQRNLNKSAEIMQISSGVRLIQLNDSWRIFKNSVNCSSRSSGLKRLNITTGHFGVWVTGSSVFFFGWQFTSARSGRESRPCGPARFSSFALSLSIPPTFLEFQWENCNVLPWRVKVLIKFFFFKNFIQSDC